MTKISWLGALAIAFGVVVALIGQNRPQSAAAGGVIDPTCTSASPCIEYDNNGTGPGIRGVSLIGNGSNGITKVNSTSATTGREGVFGNDMSTSGAFNAGVKGLSVSGMVGTSTNGVGVSGTSTTGSGISATSAQGYGLVANATLDAVRGLTSHNSTATGTGYSGVFGQDVSSDGGHLNAGVAGWSADGVGVYALSTAYVAANIVGGFRDPVSLHDFPALSIVGNTTISGGNTFLNDLIDACPSGAASPCSFMGGQVFRLFQTGDLVIAGRIYTSGSCSSGCSPTNALTETRVRFYTPQESLPTVEDLGEAQLVNGQAYVRIDPAFAKTIDPRSKYMVFITPEGDSHGVYVTAKTLAGFLVRENQGGRSTIAFSYRVVAKPYGDHPARLQMFTMALPKATRQAKPFPTYH
jgi:hypothetical protein